MIMSKFLSRLETAKGGEGQGWGGAGVGVGGSLQILLSLAKAQMKRVKKNPLIYNAV